jgi:hypothetical protein
MIHMQHATRSSAGSPVGRWVLGPWHTPGPPRGWAALPLPLPCRVSSCQYFLCSLLLSPRAPSLWLGAKPPLPHRASSTGIMGRIPPAYRRAKLGHNSRAPLLSHPTPIPLPPPSIPLPSTRPLTQRTPPTPTRAPTRPSNGHISNGRLNGHRSSSSHP